MIEYLLEWTRHIHWFCIQKHYPSLQRDMRIQQILVFAGGGSADPELRTTHLKFGGLHNRNLLSQSSED